jgi:putative pyruvate formate lyase activating enzyme
MSLYENCRLCPRACGANRHQEGKTGYCRESNELRVAYVGPHFGEEPPISGDRGSGTVFFSGCSLRCSYCQNHQISWGGTGKAIAVEELSDRVEDMIQAHRVHNLNLVTPDHFFPHAAMLISLLKGRGHELPVVLNLSGYQAKAMLAMARDYADIYLADFKYADASLATRLSNCRDYPEVALEAIAEMIRQKGFLDTFYKGAEIARKGVLVRHLMLPGETENSIDALTSLFLEFGPHLPLSLMSQYTPISPQNKGSLGRLLAQDEFDRVYGHAMELGFDCLFVQFLHHDDAEENTPDAFMPDFSCSQPFSGNPGAGGVSNL